MDCSSKCLGSQVVEGVFHGTRAHFLDFAESGYNSFGIHFGDLKQAKYFAKDSGQIIKANLHFKCLFDVGASDLGWTTELIIASLLKEKFMFTIGIFHEAFDQIVPQEFSLRSFPQTPAISPEESTRIRNLLDEHGVDGIKYKNSNEPRGANGGIAYLVLRRSQIKIVERDSPVSGKFDQNSEG